MSWLCAACHKVQSLTQHIHHWECCDLVSTNSAASPMEQELGLCAEPHHTFSGSLYVGTVPSQKWASEEAVHCGCHEVLPEGPCHIVGQEGGKEAGHKDATLFL